MHVSTSTYDNWIKLRWVRVWSESIQPKYNLMQAFVLNEGDIVYLSDPIGATALTRSIYRSRQKCSHIVYDLWRVEGCRSKITFPPSPPCKRRNGAPNVPRVLVPPSCPSISLLSSLGLVSPNSIEEGNGASCFSLCSIENFHIRLSIGVFRSVLLLLDLLLILLSQLYHWIMW